MMPELLKIKKATLPFLDARRSNAFNVVVEVESKVLSLLTFASCFDVDF